MCRIGNVDPDSLVEKNVTEQITLGGILRQYLTPRKALEVSKLTGIAVEVFEAILEGEPARLNYHELRLICDELGFEPDQLIFEVDTPVHFRRLRFSEKLKALRMRKGITQESAAKKTDIIYGTYVQYENGRRVPSYPAVISLARGLGVDANYFSDCDFGKEELPVAEDETPTRELPRFNYNSELFDDLDDDDAPPAGGSSDPIPF